MMSIGTGSDWAPSSSAATPTTAVKRNVLPSPGRLTTLMTPPITATSRAQMARPSPVPPKRRVVDASAWLKASKICCC